MIEKLRSIYEKNAIRVCLILITILLFGIGITVGNIQRVNKEMAVYTEDDRKLSANEHVSLFLCMLLDILEEATATPETQDDLPEAKIMGVHTR